MGEMMQQQLAVASTTLSLNGKPSNVWKWVLAGCAAGGLAWRLAFGPSSATRRRKFPRIKGSPFFGVFFTTDKGKSLRSHLEQWADEIGKSGVFEYSLLGMDFVCITTWELGKKVLDLRPYKVQRFARVKSLGKGLFSAEGQAWRRQRHLMTPAFHHKSMGNYCPATKSVIEQCCGLITQEAQKPDGTGQVNLSSLLSKLSATVIVKVLSGRDRGGMSSNPNPVSDVVPKYFSVLMHRARCPIAYWKWPLLSSIVPSKAVTDEMDGFVEDLITGLDDKEKVTLLAKLLEAEDGDRLDHEELIGNIRTMLLAGTDTTSSTLAWAFYELSFRPDLQQLIAAEAQASVAFPDISSPADTESMKMARAVWMECLRIHPPAPAISFTLAEPMELAGEMLPIGTHVMLLLRYMATNSQEMRTVLGEDTQVWRPERWLADSGLLRVPVLDSLCYGHGARICIGRHLAEMEGVLTISEVCRRYKLAPCEYKVGQVDNFTSSPKPDVVLGVTPRS